MTRPYVPVPSALQFDEHLTRGARDLWVLLDEQSRDRKTVHVGVEAPGPYLCRALGCSPASLRRWRAELVAAGWLYHEQPRGGPGALSLWVPLHRARTVTERTPIRIGEPAQTRSPVSGSDQRNPLTGERVDRGGTRAGGEEEEASGSGSLSTSPWCGLCESDTYRWREIPPATPRGQPQYVRCPDCHPDHVPAF